MLDALKTPDVEKALNEIEHLKNRISTETVAYRAAVAEAAKEYLANKDIVPGSVVTGFKFIGREYTGTFRDVEPCKLVSTEIAVIAIDVQFKDSVRRKNIHFSELENLCLKQ